jgi:hypothetical protein
MIITFTDLFSSQAENTSLTPAVEDELIAHESDLNGCGRVCVNERDSDMLMKDVTTAQDGNNGNHSLTQQPTSADTSTDSQGAPKFLSAQIIRYLREISDAAAWQTLITEYITFEKGDYPTGVLKK